MTRTFVLVDELTEIHIRKYKGFAMFKEKGLVFCLGETFSAFRRAKAYINNRFDKLTKA